ncbi:MAG: hypothetical protein LBJ11_09925 [Oscillospiraceae bacterium]|jgi:glycerophosphoryl diester phosphodiesterase|nr:hypothetical protein [Oscillospiraceae bacterium]
MKQKRTRKQLLRLLCIIFLAALAVGGFAWWNASPAPLPVAQLRPFTRQAGRSVFLSAHRGFSAMAPENSVPAVWAAARAGFPASEFDIYESADGVWVVMHDDTVDRTTNGTGRIADLTAAEIARLRINTGTRIERYPDLGVPTLEEMLDACQAAGIRPEIEIKAASDAGLAALTEMLRAKDMLPGAIVISFDHATLERLAAGAPELEIWYLCGAVDATVRENLTRTPQFRLAFDGNNAANTGKVVRALQKGGTKLAVWTIDAPVMFWLRWAQGVRYFTSNRIRP